MAGGPADWGNGDMKTGKRDVLLANVAKAVGDFAGSLFDSRKLTPEEAIEVISCLLAGIVYHMAKNEVDRTKLEAHALHVLQTGLRVGPAGPINPYLF